MYKIYCLYPPGYLVQRHLCFIQGVSLPLEARKEFLEERNLLRFHYIWLNKINFTEIEALCRNRHVQTWSGDICNSQWGQSMESNFNSHIPKNSTNMNFNICCFFHNNKMEKVKLDAFFQWVEFCCHLLHWQNFYQKSWKIMKIWNSWRIMKVFIWFLQSIKILWAD